MGLRLTAHDVAALEGRTEGWIAALQLAALSMQGRDDPTGFIAGFAGDDRYIVDYWSRRWCSVGPNTSEPSCCASRSWAG
jgi:ATP/maltotriose-dependent transcriptional regulator MalT